MENVYIRAVLQSTSKPDVVELRRLVEFLQRAEVNGMVPVDRVELLAWESKDGKLGIRSCMGPSTVLDVTQGRAQFNLRGSECILRDPVIYFDPCHGSAPASMDQLREFCLALEKTVCEFMGWGSIYIYIETSELASRTRD